MRCNGAGLARFHEWKVNLPGPLIAAVPQSICNRWGVVVFAGRGDLFRF